MNFVPRDGLVPGSLDETLSGRFEWYFSRHGFDVTSNRHRLATFFREPQHQYFASVIKIISAGCAGRDSKAGLCTVDYEERVELLVVHISTKSLPAKVPSTHAGAFQRHTSQRMKPI